MTEGRTKKRRFSSKLMTNAMKKQGVVLTRKARLLSLPRVQGVSACAGCKGKALPGIQRAAPVGRVSGGSADAGCRGKALAECPEGSVLWVGCRVTTPAQMQGKALPGVQRRSALAHRHFAARRRRDESVIVGSNTSAEVFVPPPMNGEHHQTMIQNGPPSYEQRRPPTNERRDAMARNDGIDRTCARNKPVKGNGIGRIEGHN